MIYLTSGSRSSTQFNMYFGGVTSLQRKFYLKIFFSSWPSILNWVLV